MRALPIYKVGLVLLREADSASPRVLLVRPQPKHVGEIAPLVLPRGSRQYRDAHGQWHDIRDDETARAVRDDQLEPLTQTLRREAEEEAGVPAALLATAPLCDVGVMEYQSQVGAVKRQIHWYALPISEAQYATLTPPSDAAETRWVTLPEHRVLIAKGEARPYADVVERALTQLG